MKKIELNQTGNYLVAELTGVDFVSSGTLENGTKYGASVKLKFVQNQKVLKNIAGADIETLKAVAQIVKISCTDDTLVPIVQKYNEKIGQIIMVQYTPNDNTSFLAKETDIKFLD